MRLPSLALFALSVLTGFAQQPSAPAATVAGHWLGTLYVGVPMRLTFSIAEKDGKLTGTMASLDQSSAKIPLTAASEKDGAASFEIANILGVFEGKLSKDGSELARLAGADEKKVAKRTAVGREAIRLLTENLADAAIEKRLRELLEEALREATPGELAKAPPLETSLAMSMAQVRSPWQCWAVRYDPAPTLRAVKCPVLAINGEKDCQVAARENIGGIDRGLAEGGNKHVKTAILPGLNHLFQTCQTGALKEYGEVEETMSPAVLAMVAEWILQAGH